MPTKSRSKQIKTVLKNTDDIIHIFTGKRLKNIVGTGINLFGEELVKKASHIFSGEGEKDLALDSPYRVLGIHPEAVDTVVKAAFRALAKEYHPDTGMNPDPAKFQKAQEAYDAIMKERREKIEPSK